MAKKGNKNNKLNKQEREEVALCKTISLAVLGDEATNQLQLQLQDNESNLNKFLDLLCTNKGLLKEMLECYHNVFIHLYLDTEKKKDQLLNFYHHCSVMLPEELSIQCDCMKLTYICTSTIIQRS